MPKFLLKFNSIHKLSQKKTKNLLQILQLMFQRGGAQGIVFISTIFATKYFLPEDFGLVGLFTSICSFLALASGFRFEIRSLVCKQELSREKFISMAYLVNLLFFLVFFSLSLLLYILSIVKAWFLLIPFSVFFFSLIQYILPAQNSKIHHLKKLGVMTQFIAIIIAVGQFLGALFFQNVWILIFSRIVAWLFGLIYMRKSVCVGLKNIQKIGLHNFKKIFRVCRKEILYGIPAALFSVVTLQIPAYIYGIYDMESEVGIYWLAFNLMFMPYLIISSSIRPIFIRHLSSHNVENKFKFLLKYTLVSTALGCIFSLLINIIMYILCKYYFPEDWSNSINYTLALSFLLVSLFSQTCLSFSIPIFNLQGFNFIGNILQVLSRVLVMLIILILYKKPIYAIWGFSIVSFIGYIFYIFYGLYRVKLYSLIKLEVRRAK